MKGNAESVGKEGKKMVRRKVTDAEILLRFQDLVIQRRSRGCSLLAVSVAPPTAPCSQGDMHRKNKPPEKTSVDTYCTYDLVVF